MTMAFNIAPRRLVICTTKNTTALPYAHWHTAGCGFATQSSMKIENQYPGFWVSSGLILIWSAGIGNNAS